MGRLIAEYAGQLPIRAFIVSQDKALFEAVQALWPPDEIAWQPFGEMESALPALFNDPPELVLIDTRASFISEGADCAAGIRAIKGDSAYSSVTIVLCLGKGSDLSAMDELMLEVDDFIFFPDLPDIYKLSFILAFSRSRRSLDVNPLSHLPGNTSIIRYIQGLIDRKVDFALAYADLDHFKAFNDKYGFSRGDEVLHFTARMISGSVRASGASFSFVGHIGGDDFVFVLPTDLMEEATQRMIASFDSIAPSFYDTEDRKRGSILTTDRQGRPQLFPVLSLSIAVIFNRDGCLRHFGEAAERASQLKHLAKKEPGSICKFDRRLCEPEDESPAMPKGGGHAPQA